MGWGPLPSVINEGRQDCVVEDEAERVRLIYRRYLELGGVNALVRDLRKQISEPNLDCSRRCHPRGILSPWVVVYLLRNRFYIVRSNTRTDPARRAAAIMDRALFDAVQQKLTDQWTTRSTSRNANDHRTDCCSVDAGRRHVDSTSRVTIRSRSVKWTGWSTDRELLLDRIKSARSMIAGCSPGRISSCI